MLGNVVDSNAFISVCTDLRRLPGRLIWFADWSEIKLLCIVAITFARSVSIFWYSSTYNHGMVSNRNKHDWGEVVKIDNLPC
jgi:hypothetical protein